MKSRTCNTPQLLELARASAMAPERMEELEKTLDPTGTHLLNMSMIHNDAEVRTWWFTKRRDTMEPVSLWLDVSFDAFRAHTEVPEHGDR